MQIVTNVTIVNWTPAFLNSAYVSTDFSETPNLAFGWCDIQQKKPCFHVELKTAASIAPNIPIVNEWKKEIVKI